MTEGLRKKAIQRIKNADEEICPTCFAGCMDCFDAGKTHIEHVAELRAKIATLEAESTIMRRRHSRQAETIRRLIQLENGSVQDALESERLTRENLDVMVREGFDKSAQLVPEVLDRVSWERGYVQCGVDVRDAILERQVPTGEKCFCGRHNDGWVTPDVNTFGGFQHEEHGTASCRIVGSSDGYRFTRDIERDESTQ